MWLRPLLAAACLVVILATVALAAPSSDDAQLALESASDARVVLPDGSVVSAEAGLALPDGTTITAGDEALVIDGQSIAPGETVVIRDGEVQARAGSPDDTVAAPPVGSGDDRPGSDLTTTTRPGDDPPVQAQPPPIVTDPQTGPRPVPPAPTPPTKPSTTTTTTTRPAGPAPLMLSTSRSENRRISLSWTSYRGDEFARYVVVRTFSNSDDPPPRPVGPSDGEQVFTSTNPQAVAARDTLPRGAVSAAYRVFVLDPVGNVVGISNIAAGLIS